jgi:hypothetical protein
MLQSSREQRRRRARRLTTLTSWCAVSPFWKCFHFSSVTLIISHQSSPLWKLRSLRLCKPFDRLKIGKFCINCLCVYKYVVSASPLPLFSDLGYQITDDQAALRQIMRLRGYSVMKTVLDDYLEDLDIQELVCLLVDIECHPG